jgi:NTP pyrophosphatase (non-canonical NTP hydrolase)
MTLNEYQQLAFRTAAPREGEGAVTAGHDLMHAGLGFATESGEFLDVLKKQHAYGKPLDAVNLREEVGDLLWYCAIACRGLGITLEDAAQVNIAKLAERFPNRFTNEAALNRDLTAERRVLEAGAITMDPNIAVPALPAKPKPTPSRITLGTGNMLEWVGGVWQVSNGAGVIAKTGGDNRTLLVTPDGNDGPWLFAAQATLDAILDQR